ncbi:MAG: beta-galactosidase [Treponema sp.]|jgi:hypothetical protein|nr:beta-galactosidase [Treponema sp.]
MNKIIRLSTALLLLAVIVIAAAPLFFSCASAPRPPLDEQIIPADIAGLVHAGGTNTQQEYDLLDNMGAVWILHTFYWDRIQPAEGEWDFSSFDILVDTAKASGKKVLGVLAYDTPWIHADGKTRKYIPPDKLPLFLDYVRKTAAYFRGRVDAWCIWNEPNFHFWNGTPQEFFTLARQTAAAVREVDTDVSLLGGAFNRGIFGLPKKYIRGLFDSGAMEQASALAFHPYELNPARTARLYDQFGDIAAEYGFGGKIWITEVGYPTGGWYPTAVSEKKFPAYVIKTFTLLSVRGARTIFWYQLFDPEVRERGNSEDYFGLVRSRQDYRSKGAEAFRLCARYISGTRYYPQKPQRKGLPSSLRSFYFEGLSAQETGGSGVLVLWKDGAPITVHLRLPGESHLMHDPVSGSAAAIPAETIIKAGSAPVFITWQGGAGGPCELWR